MAEEEEFLMRLKNVVGDRGDVSRNDSWVWLERS